MVCQCFMRLLVPSPTLGWSLYSPILHGIPTKWPRTWARTWTRARTCTRNYRVEETQLWSGILWKSIQVSPSVTYLLKSISQTILGKYHLACDPMQKISASPEMSQLFVFSASMSKVFVILATVHCLRRFISKVYAKVCKQEISKYV